MSCQTGAAKTHCSATTGVFDRGKTIRTGALWSNETWPRRKHLVQRASSALSWAYSQRRAFSKPNNPDPTSTLWLHPGSTVIRYSPYGLTPPGRCAVRPHRDVMGMTGNNHVLTPTAAIKVLHPTTLSVSTSAGPGSGSDSSTGSRSGL